LHDALPILVYTLSLHDALPIFGDAGDISASGTNQNNPKYIQFFRVTDIVRPSNIFVFLDEHPDSINDGYFVNKAYVPKWLDLPRSEEHSLNSSHLGISYAVFCL